MVRALIPTPSSWPDGVADFPDMAASHAALQSLNIGGWTDWVINVKWDGRGPNEGGNGFLKIWKRDGFGPWVEVLDIRPKITSRGGETFAHGIGFKIPGSGYGPLAGMYTDKERAWNSRRNRVIYNDNIKIGSDTSDFSEMSPDGSNARFWIRMLRNLCRRHLRRLTSHWHASEQQAYLSTAAASRSIATY